MFASREVILGLRMRHGDRPGMTHGRRAARQTEEDRVYQESSVRGLHRGEHENEGKNPVKGPRDSVTPAFRARGDAPRK
jgi:hypothetical protein